MAALPQEVPARPLEKNREPAPMGFLIPTLFGDSAFFTQISRSFPAVPERPRFLRGGSSARCRVAAGARSEQGRGLLADTGKDVPRSIP